MFVRLAGRDGGRLPAAAAPVVVAPWLLLLLLLRERGGWATRRANDMSVITHGGMNGNDDQAAVALFSSPRDGVNEALPWRLGGLCSSAPPARAVDDLALAAW